MDDSGVADAFYTLLSISMVIVMGLAISSIILSVTSQTSNDASSRLAEYSSSAMKKGLYVFYYAIDMGQSDLSSADPNDIQLKTLEYRGVDEKICLVNNRPKESAGEYGSVIWAGYIYVPASGEYRFELKSIGGSWAWVDGQLLIDSHGTHALSTVQGSPVYLKEGYHPLKLKYFYMDGNEATCELSWDVKGTMSPVDTFYR